ncbi:Higher eukaryotic phosphomevalonate kinase [Penicillium occitanis (nom. inval.)]|nr:Higher eukaryotic phosphomevalonate kinase [Penicillium occitanis (nom. inval.)]
MATLKALKLALQQKADETTASSMKHPLSDAQNTAGLEILLQGSGWLTYQESVIPQLLEQLTPIFNSRDRISVLEIGPGPKSILAYLPSYMRRQIDKYTAFEPNRLFATELDCWICPTIVTEEPGRGQRRRDRRPRSREPHHLFSTRTNRAKSPFPRLNFLPKIHRIPFVLDNGTSDNDEKYDVILFWHGMYGMEYRRKFIEKAIEMLTLGGLVVVFHRDGDFDGPVCHRTTSIPTGVVCVPDEDRILDLFASFIAGFATDEDDALRIEWREVCRTLARREDALPNKLLFAAPDVIFSFNSHSASLSELTAIVPMANEDRYETIKNREARLRHNTPIVRPTEIRHVQACVHWAVKHGVSLTVVGGGRSGHCLWPNVLAVDMAAFDNVHILPAEDVEDALIVAEAGCKTGDIINKAMQAGLTVPLGARPSVGSADLLWAIKGAGTNFGIVVSVTFKAYVTPMFLVRNWVFPLKADAEAQLKLNEFDKRIARELPRDSSVDAYLYWDAGELRLGVTMFEASTTLTFSAPESSTIDAMLGPDIDSKVVNAVELFDTEMYVSKMHGGHGQGKTSSFKRCLFLKHIGEPNVTKCLISAVEARPTPLCYLHLLHGGGAVGDVAANATAFSCRDWDFVCVITGVWPRDQDDTELARATVRWVYSVVEDLLPLSRRAYGADLGPDARDVALVAKASGANFLRLKRLKRSFDPHNVLAYACPLQKASLGPKLIILVTGKSGVGKDHCANIWVSVFRRRDTRLRVRAISISDATKRQYAEATGADLDLLVSDRAYKEEHRPALSVFFQEQTQQRPQLPVEHFQNVVYENSDVDVLFITGMRDEAPVATFSHLVPESRLLDVHVQVSEQLRRTRRELHSHEDDRDASDSENSDLEYSPNFVFNNDRHTVAMTFAARYLLPFVHEDLHQLIGMVPRVLDFPRPGTEFRDVLGISKKRGGLALVTSLLHSHFTGDTRDWSKVDAVVTFETGGIVFASPLATRADVPLVIIRDTGKLPPPTLSIMKSSSYITSLAANDSKEKWIEMEQDAVRPGSSVVVVDDVLSTGKTLCAVLQLLEKAGVGAESIRVMVVVEFPLHRGREYLRQRGFGKVGIQSLLVFGGA